MKIQWDRTYQNKAKTNENKSSMTSIVLEDSLMQQEGDHNRSLFFFCFFFLLKEISAPVIICKGMSDSSGPTGGQDVEVWSCPHPSCLLSLHVCHPIIHFSYYPFC